VLLLIDNLKIKWFFKLLTLYFCLTNILLYINNVIITYLSAYLLIVIWDTVTIIKYFICILFVVKSQVHTLFN